MKFSHPKIGDFVKVKHTMAGIDCVALVVGELVYYNKDSASVPVLLSMKFSSNDGKQEVTVHYYNKDSASVPVLLSTVEILNGNR